MIRDSLRLRLLAAGAIAILGALVLAGVGLGWIFERHIEQRETDILVRDGKLLIGGLRFDSHGTPVADAQPGDDRYGEAGSGLYWQLTTSRGSVHSVSLWDQSLPLASDEDSEEWRVRHVLGPFGKSLLLAERPVRPARNAEPVLVQIATDDAPLRAARREFDWEMAGSLGMLWLLLLLAAYLQVSLGLRPLMAIQQQIERLKRYPAARLPANHPREISPLADAINALADAREADVSRARKRAGDLAHSLKTPLAAMSAQSRRARESGATDAADGLDRAITAMSAALETELARTRAAAARDTGHSNEGDINTLVENIIAVVERTEHGERIVFEVSVEETLQVPVAAEDLTELLGALIENAARYARRLVRISAKAEEGASVLAIEDDGPGIGREAAEAVMIRGGRLDEAGAGHGLGLAIVSDLMQATGGSVILDRASLGGLRVRLAWPPDQELARP